MIRIRGDEDGSRFLPVQEDGADSHIGTFGSLFNVAFDGTLLAARMRKYNIGKTILCPAAPLNAELSAVWKQSPPYGSSHDARITRSWDAAAPMPNAFKAIS